MGMACRRMYEIYSSTASWMAVLLLDTVQNDIQKNNWFLAICLLVLIGNLI
jgi:hypothetical protein